MSAAHVLWLPLGELLVERGLLSNVQLELALSEQRRTGLRLGEVLVSMGFVSEEALARMLLEQVGLSTTEEPEVPEEHAVEPVEEPEPEPDLEPGVAVVWERRQPDPELAADAEAEPEPQPEAEPQPEPEPELRVAAYPQPEAERRVEPVIIRMDAPERERGRWWSRNGNKARIRELEKVLSDFEQRSRAIEADIMRVRTALRDLRDAKA